MHSSMKIVVVVAVLVAVVSCGYSSGSHGSGNHGGGGYGGASSNSHHSQNGYDNYDFGYDVQDPHYNNYQGRQETGSGDTVKGSYYLREADGSMRRVNYVATHPGGFVATVSDKHGSKTYGNTGYGNGDDSGYGSSGSSYGQDGGSHGGSGGKGY